MHSLQQNSPQINTPSPSPKLMQRCRNIKHHNRSIFRNGGEAVARLIWWNIATSPHRHTLLHQVPRQVIHQTEGAFLNLRATVTPHRCNPQIEACAKLSIWTTQHSTAVHAPPQHRLQLTPFWGLSHHAAQIRSPEKQYDLRTLIEACIGNSDPAPSIVIIKIHVSA